MKHFPEIIRILDRFRERRIETVDGNFKSRPNDKAFRLYEGIKAGEFSSDHAAALALYSSDPLDSRYTTLKSRLKSRLINSLFHLNLRRAGFSEYAQAVYSCNRRVFLSQTLIGLGARSSGALIAKRTLKDAEEFHLTQPAVLLLAILRQHSFISGRPAEYERLDSILHIKSETLIGELLSSGLFERAQYLLSTKTGGISIYREALEDYVRQLDSVPEVNRSFSFRIDYFRLSVLAHSAAGRHTSKIDVCNAAINYLNLNPKLASTGRLAEFQVQKLESFVAIRDYESGRATVLACSNLLPVGSPNWFGFAEFNFLLLMHTQHFLDAEQLYLQVLEQPRFATNPEFWQERWKLFELYLNYALQSVPEFDSAPIKKKFDLQSVLRFMPVAAKDKHGLYIAVLIIHILYMLEMKDFSGIIDRMDALRTYRTRYLRSGGNRRSAIFFKLLTIMENNSFSYKLVLAKSERHLKELLAAELEDADTDEELQVIPYEWLWERILEKLKSFEHHYAQPSRSS